MKIKNVLESIRIKLSDTVAAAIATWTFILVYTLSMLIWIVLHKYQVLHIDSEDFIKYNLFLSWAAGIQASIVLMASNRQTELDRKAITQSLELDKKVFELTTNQEQSNALSVLKMTKKLNSIAVKIDKLEEIIGLMEEEEDEIQKGKNNA